MANSRVSSEAFRRQCSASKTLVVNLVSSPGAGKTSLLEATARHWRDKHSMAVLVGDIATDRDAQRLAPLVEVVQMTTGGACHLEMPLVEQAFQKLNQRSLDFLFIENVGNLVCPASHDLGEHLRVVLLSVTEGDDKPAKYPKMFRTSQALVITKTDLLPYLRFSVEAAAMDARRIQPHIPLFPLSSLDGDGLPAWCQFLEEARRRIFTCET
jgi:hydrogenase nickel incorporation protein HypB